MASRYTDQHPEALVWDNPATHANLIKRLEQDFEAWAMSLSEPSLRTILPMTAEHVRVMAWCKPWCSFKPGYKQPHHAWDPVLVKCGRKIERRLHGVRDYMVAPIAMQTGFFGAKSLQFCFWIFEILNARPGDDFVDLFPGSGAVSRAWDEWQRQFKFLNHELEAAI